MAVPRPTPASRAAFSALVPDAPHVDVRPMFGNEGAFVNGNLFMALYGDAVTFKLDPGSLAEARLRDDAQPFAPGGKTMREYVLLPVKAAGLENYVHRALAYVAGLPPKSPRR